MKTALITGINGFVGPYLTRLLQSHGYSVWGVDRLPECSIEGVSYRGVDILDTGELSAAFLQAAPDEVYHLAGVSYLPDADATPGLALRINIFGGVSVLDAVRASCPGARVLMIGSSKEYDNTASSEAISETAPPNPTDFYGVSKYSAELIGRQYVRQFGTDVRFTRSFNHTGVGQSPRFVCSDWARQAALIFLGKAEPAIKVGSLDADIDFSDVRDVVRGYHAILDKGQKGEAYNVCSGRAVSLRFILEYLVGKTGKKVDVQSQESRKRAHVTSPRLVGDNTKIISHTGWKPEFSIEQTLDGLFEYWLKEEAKDKKSG